MPVNRSIEECGYTSWPRTLYRTPSNSTGTLFARSGAKGGYTQVQETSVTPDAVDAIDVNDVANGLVEYGLATGSSSASGCVALSERRAG